MYNVCTLTRFLTIHHYVLRPITRQQIFTFNAPLRTERSAKIRAPTVKAQIRLTVWRRCGAEGLSKGNLLFWHCSSLSGNCVFHIRWFFENRLLAAQIAQIPHCAPYRRINYELCIVWVLSAAGVWRSERKPPPLHYDTGHVNIRRHNFWHKKRPKAILDALCTPCPDSTQTPFNHSGFIPQLRWYTVLPARWKTASKSTGICSISVPYILC